MSIEFIRNLPSPEEIKEENLETNENKSTSVLNLWDAAKVVLSRKFIAIQSYLKKQERTQIVTRL